MASKSMSLGRCLRGGYRVEGLQGSSRHRQISAGACRGIANRSHVERTRCLQPVSITSLHNARNRQSRLPRQFQVRYLAQVAASEDSGSVEHATSQLDLDFDYPKLDRQLHFANRMEALKRAVESAVSAVQQRYGKENVGEKLDVIGLRGSHEDKFEGCFLPFPTIKSIIGRWRIEAPLGMKRELLPRRTFDKLTDVFNIAKRAEGPEGTRYRYYIKSAIEAALAEGKNFGAVVLEPLIIESGNGEFVDPLFQHMLVKVVRQNPQLFTSSEKSPPPDSWKGLPVIFDETFTGSYRLGRLNAASFIMKKPNISIHIKDFDSDKCVALTNEDIYEASSQIGKTDTAETGREAAKTSLPKLKELDSSGAWNQYKADWLASAPTVPNRGIWSMWSHNFIQNLSSQAKATVRETMALGSVFTITLHPKEPKDPKNPKPENKTTVTDLQELVQAQDPTGVDFESKVVNENTIYVMGKVTTDVERYKSVQDAISKALGVAEST